MSLRDQLQAIYDQHGKLTPELVVEAARPKGHPLHDRVFDRSPREAAEAWYRDRAHELIQSYRVTYKKGNGEIGSVRGFHAVPSDGPEQFVYEPMDKVAHDPFTRQLVLRAMEREWKQLYARYEDFEEFLQMVGAEVKRRAG